MQDTEGGSAPVGVPARVRLDVAYDGTGFAGWAVQPGQRTVAGELTRALERLFRTPTGLTVAGRTDAGVHATGQVCQVDLPRAAWDELGPALIRRMAGLLPADVRVLAAAETHPDFDARFSALWRRYEYRVTDAPWGADPLRRVNTLAWPRRLAEDAMNEAAQGLVGEHDFAAFCRRKENATTIRRITALEWRREGDVLVATVQADAFCQQMVRSLVGALLAVGEGRRAVTWPAELLDRTERDSGVLVAPAHGLTLVAVGYPDESRFAQQAMATRKVRQRSDR